MSRNYYEIIDDLNKGVMNKAVAARAKKAIEELLMVHELDQSEIVRLRRMVEAMETSDEKKIEDIKEGNRSPYRRRT